MKEKIEEFLKQKEQLIQELKEWVVNKSIPLEERWEVFIESNLGEDYPWIERFDSVVGKVFVESRDDKYETHRVEWILEWANEQSLDEDEDDEKLLFSQQEIEEFMENVLSKFYKSFKLDW